MKINRGMVVVGTVGVAILLALAGCNDDAIAIASTDVGPEWPFTVSEVRVVCAPTFALFIHTHVAGRVHPQGNRGLRQGRQVGSRQRNRLIGALNRAGVCVASCHRRHARKPWTSSSCLVLVSAHRITVLIALVPLSAALKEWPTLDRGHR